MAVGRASLALSRFAAHTKSMFLVQISTFAGGSEVIWAKKMYQYKAGTPHREGSELSLKRVKRKQTEDEAGNHRGLSATEPSKKGVADSFSRWRYAPSSRQSPWAWAWAWNCFLLGR